MRNFLKENIGSLAELTLSHSGQKAQIAGTIQDVRDNMILLGTDDGLIAGDMNNLLYVRMLAPQNDQQNTSKNPVPEDAENTKTSAKFAPILNWTENRMQTIL